MASRWVRNGHGFVAVDALDGQVTCAHFLSDLTRSFVLRISFEACIARAHAALKRRYLFAVSRHVTMGLPAMVARLHIGSFLQKVVLRPGVQSVLLAWYYLHVLISCVLTDLHQADIIVRCLAMLVDIPIRNLRGCPSLIDSNLILLLNRRIFVKKHLRITFLAFR